MRKQIVLGQGRASMMGVLCQVGGGHGREEVNPADKNGRIKVLSSRKSEDATWGKGTNNCGRK